MAHPTAPALVIRDGEGGAGQITNTRHNKITADLLTAETAQAAHKQTPARVPLGEIAAGQQVLETETRLALRR